MNRLLRFGTAHTRAQSRIAGVSGLTVAVTVVVAGATVIVTAIAGTTVVAVEPVRVATPPRVPGIARAPLREGSGLGLGDGGRSQTGEP